MKNLFPLFLLLSLTASAQQTTTVAKVEPVHITETNVLWTASVVDTLKYCVINAKSIAVMNASFPKEKNITREVSFKVKNKEGEGKTVNSTITGVAEWNGVKCYTVLLDVGMNFQTHKVYRKVDCILADLENDEFKLYIGKNWLGDDMKVK
jgi:hypothetical protein